MTIKLNQNNYYDIKTDWEYFSPTFFKKFLKCEAAAVAQLNEVWAPTSDPTALLVGNYIHSYFESKESHERFINENESAMKTRSGTFKAPYKQADRMIKVLEEDPFVMNAYHGQKEVIVTGELFGQKWKGKLDNFNLEDGYFADLKTTADVHKKVWDSELHRYVSFIEGYDYVLQMAVYHELIKQQFGVDVDCFIIAVSKQDPPDHEAIFIEKERYQRFIDLIEEKTSRIQAVMNGEVAPIRCEQCEYCRKTKRLSNFITIDDLID